MIPDSIKTIGKGIASAVLTFAVTGDQGHWKDALDGWLGTLSVLAALIVSVLTAIYMIKKIEKLK